MQQHWAFTNHNYIFWPLPCTIFFVLRSLEWLSSGVISIFIYHNWYIFCYLESGAYFGFFQPKMVLFEWIKVKLLYVALLQYHMNREDKNKQCKVITAISAVPGIGNYINFANGGVFTNKYCLKWINCNGNIHVYPGMWLHQQKLVSDGGPLQQEL